MSDLQRSELFAPILIASTGQHLTARMVKVARSEILMFQVNSQE